MPHHEGQPLQPVADGCESPGVALTQGSLLLQAEAHTLAIVQSGHRPSNSRIARKAFSTSSRLESVYPLFRSTSSATSRTSYCAD